MNLTSVTYIDYYKSLSIKLNLNKYLLILIISLILCLYLYYKYKNKNNKHINISYDVHIYYVPDYGKGKLLGVYDKNPVSNLILQEWFFFYSTKMPPYVVPVLIFSFDNRGLPKRVRIEYLNLYKEYDGMLVIIKERKYAYTVFADSCKHAFPLDNGQENLWCYIPSTKKIRTAGLTGFITYYINIPFFLPQGGGIWVQGPPSYIGLLYYKIKGYKFYSGGKPLLWRINKNFELEIFIRDDN